MLQARIENGFGIENVQWAKAPSPQAGPGQVLVRMRAASLNFRDLLLATGKYDPKLPMPRVMGSDGAGEVIGLGEGTKRFRLGDRVAGIFMQGWLAGRYRDSYASSALGGAIDGVFSQEVVLDEEGLVAIPQHLSFEEAAALPCAGVTAWNSLFASGDLRSGETVLVLGSGGVSVFALQLAKAAGARVIATSSQPEKMEMLKAMGADWVLNYKEVADWGKVIAKAGGVDHVVEVGGAGSLEQSLLAVRGGGRVSLIGVLSGAAGPINIGRVLHKHVTVQGIYVGSREMFEAMNAAIVQNHIRPVIDSVYEGAQIQEALRHMESAGHFGKIVLRLD
ncbi:zinc-dependent alcohol dehydrogenase family protein [Bryobacter aggregatus]|uniref:zinc-dependent alcohol dehydrogenase family protein n=1 Tax=Bryobacter aggregatus TaxID=360054 RepID=UPI0004E11C1E|nr:NAD(P)-dependent alcohol dehydrogenase [Bryobacter aggregatus]